MRILNLISVLSLTILASAPLFAAAVDLYDNGYDDVSSTQPLSQAFDGEEAFPPTLPLSPTTSLVSPLVEEEEETDVKVPPLYLTYNHVADIYESSPQPFKSKGVEFGFENFANRQSSKNWKKFNLDNMSKFKRYELQPTENTKEFIAWYEAVAEDDSPLDDENGIKFSVMCSVTDEKATADGA